MYRDRGVSGSKLEIGSLDRKRINDALDKHLEKSSPSTSRGLNGREKERLSVPSASARKQPENYRDQRSAPLSKSKCSDGKCFSFLFFFFIISIFFPFGILLIFLLLLSF